MRIFIVLQVILSIFFEKNGYLFLEGRNLEINSDICIKQDSVYVCEMERGQNLIKLDVAPVRCDIPYSILQASWMENGMMQTQIIEVSPRCVLYLPYVESQDFQSKTGH